MLTERQKEGNAVEASRLYQHLVLLLQCRERGVEMAFKNLIINTAHAQGLLS
jgi:hypothetical protein